MLLLSYLMRDEGKVLRFVVVPRVAIWSVCPSHHAQTANCREESTTGTCRGVTRRVQHRNVDRRQRRGSVCSKGRGSTNCIYFVSCFVITSRAEPETNGPQLGFHVVLLSS